MASKNRAEASIKEHRDIIDAIKSKNEDKAEQYAVYHMNKTIENIDITINVRIEGDRNINYYKTGTYVITYTLNNQIYNIVLQRIVNVGGDSNGN